MRDILISDVQISLHKMYIEHYSEEKLRQYQNVVEELTKKKETTRLEKQETTKLNNIYNIYVSNSTLRKCWIY